MPQHDSHTLDDVEISHFCRVCAPSTPWFLDMHFACVQPHTLSTPHILQFASICIYSRWRTRQMGVAKVCPIYCGCLFLPSLLSDVFLAAFSTESFLVSSHFIPHLLLSPSHKSFPSPSRPPPLSPPPLSRCVLSFLCFLPSFLPSLTHSPTHACTSPRLASPRLASPHLTSPHLTSPHLTSPHPPCSSFCLLSPFLVFNVVCFCCFRVC